MTDARPTPLPVALVTVTYQSVGMADFFAETARAFERIVVVDNASTDGSARAFGERLPQAQVIELPRNLGFGCANNVGFRRALDWGCPYILFINPDVQITPEAVRTLVSTLQDNPRLGLVNPLMTDGQGQPMALSTWDFTRPYRDKAPQRVNAQGAASPVIEQACIDGSCLLVRTSAFANIGGFNEDLFMYCEEDDVCLRLARAGYLTAFDLRAPAVHLKAASTPLTLRVRLRKAYSVRWSRFLMTDRYVGRTHRVAEVLRVLVAAPLVLPIFALTGRRASLVKWLGWGAAALDGVFMTRLFRRVL